MSVNMTVYCQISGLSVDQKREIATALVLHPILMEENANLAIYIDELKKNVSLRQSKIDIQQEIIKQKDLLIANLEEQKRLASKPKSGLFVYGETNINGFDNYGLGLDYQLKNKIIIGASMVYNDVYNYGSINIKFGVKIF